MFTYDEDAATPWYDDATGDATFPIWGTQIKIPHVETPPH